MVNYLSKEEMLTKMAELLDVAGVAERGGVEHHHADILEAAVL